jgi:hypothetical protein
MWNQYVQLPSLEAEALAQSEEIEQYNIKGLGLSVEEADSSGSKTHTVRLSAAKPRPKKTLAPDSSLSAAERMWLIISGDIAEKKGDLLAREPAELATKLIEFLMQGKFLPQ